MGYTDGRSTPSAPSATAAHRERRRPAPLDLGQPYPFFLAHPLDLPLDRVRGPARRAGRLDRRVEVRRHPRPGGQARRPGLDLVARRGARHRALPGDRRRWRRRCPTAPCSTARSSSGRTARVAPFALLQQRIGRKTLTKKVLAEAPVGFIAYDLLEWGGVDLRERPQHERRALLEALAAHGRRSMRCSPVDAVAPSWRATARAPARRESRARGVEGFMLKHRQARYGTGRKQDDSPRHLVEVEDRSAQRRLRAHLRAGRPRPPRQRLHRLHLRGLEPGAGRCRRGAGRRRRDRPPRAARARGAAAGAVRQGLLGPHRRGVPASTASSGRPRSRSSARCAASGRAWSSSSASRASTAARGTRAASPCASRACCASATTSRCTRPTRWQSLEALLASYSSLSR